MIILLLEDDHDLPLATLNRPSYSTYFRTTSPFTPLMCQIVGIHVKHTKMCQVIRHAKMCKGVSMCVRDFQDNKREKKFRLQGNEHIIGLINHQFTFSKRGMLGTPTTIFPNGKSRNIVHKHGNSSEDQCINVRDQYGAFLFIIISVNMCKIMGTNHVT